MAPLAEGIFTLFGALGLFLYAIAGFSDGMQKVIGERIRIILEKQAKRPVSSIFNGIGMAAALQSNYLTFGIVASLINAGLLGLLPALWIMLGVNLGMTVTPQFLSLNIDASLFLLLFGGYLFYFYGKRRNWHYLGQILFNLGLLYLCVSIFHRSFLALGKDVAAARLLNGIMFHPWLGFLLGLGLAALFRGSNMVVVLTQGLAGIGLQPAAPAFLGCAVALVAGANVGAAMINLLIGGRDRLPVVRKANWLHFSFNLTTALAWLAALPAAVFLVKAASVGLGRYFQIFAKSVFNIDLPGDILSGPWFDIWQIAMVHTLFNLTVILIWFPLTALSSKSGLSLLAEKGKINAVNGTTYLDRRALQTPALALMLASREIKQMAAITLGMLNMSRMAFAKGQVHFLDIINRDEGIIDDFQEQITFYLSALLSQNSLTENQSHRLAALLHIVSDVERVGDHANNIARLAEKKYQEQLQFSELALNEIELMYGKITDFYHKACLAFTEEKPELAKQILSREENIDKLEEELRQNHIHRLNQGKCWPSSGVVYIEMLNNLQRIGAHSSSLAGAILEEGEN